MAAELQLSGVFDWPALDAVSGTAMYRGRPLPGAAGRRQCGRSRRGSLLKSPPSCVMPAQQPLPYVGDTT